MQAIDLANWSEFENTIQDVRRESFATRGSLGVDAPVYKSPIFTGVGNSEWKQLSALVRD
jgi:hypothetical protein